MSRFRLLALVLVGLGLMALPACGGGGQGLRTPNDPVKVMSTSLPSKMSGETLNHVIPLDGGCGGPYVLKVISGLMPDGLELDDENHAIVGYLGEDGQFSFTVEVTDTGCTPFSATTAQFSMSVGVGDITVVAVRKDGNPAKFTPAGEAYSPADERPPEEREPYNPDYPALPDTIFNEYTLLDVVIAGGVGPYAINIADLPGIPDGGLPLGTSLIEDSTSVNGTPIEEAPEGAFLLTFEITDSVGSKGQFTAYWLVYSPPLYIGTDNLSDGRCGSQYSEQFFTAGGIPPFNHEFVDAVGSRTKRTAADYPPDAAAGPNYSSYLVPPKGIYIEEDTGRMRGIPRMRGTFSIMYHVSSTLLPFSATQNRWREFSFYMDASSPLAQNASYTVEGAPFAPFAAPPYNRIPDIEVGSPYNPDALTHTPPGLLALAAGGVPYDGEPDHPHWSQILADTTSPPEVPDSYNWSIDWGPDGQIPGCDFSIDGVFDVVDANALVKMSFQNVAFKVADQALPLSFAGEDEQWLRVSIGPDTVIVTESTTSFSGGLGSTSTYDSYGLDDREMTVKLLLPFKSGAQLKTLVETRDMAGKDGDQHEVPSTAGTFTSSNDPLGTTLTDVDFLRVSVNPNGWWNDIYNMNPRGARGMQHTDANRAKASYHSNAYAYEYLSTYKYTSGSYSYSYTYAYDYGAQPETVAVHIPDYTAPEGGTPAVTADPDLGVYTDGGKLYCFDSEDRFGVFIVRDDSKIYMPVAIDKDRSVGPSSKSFDCFGDNVNKDYDTEVTGTVYQIPQMTVSPDGRFAAMKLMTKPASYSTSAYTNYGYSYDWLGDNASQSGIVVFSLTGEKLWNGNPYKIINTGSNGTSSYGTMMLAGTMTLTNGHLYYVCANRGYYSSYSWREQFAYRYDLLGGANAGAIIEDGNDGSASDDPEWTQEPGEWMQLPCGKLDRVTYSYSYSYGYTYSYYSYGYEYADYNIYDDGYQRHEGSTAPVPFRVNADGDSCVIIAGEWGYPYTTSQSSAPYGNASWHMHHVFLDQYTGSGSPTMYRLSEKKRRIPQGTSRGYGLRDGAAYYVHHWGAQTGPTPGVEISDDGTKVAVCVSRVPDTTAIFGYSSYSYSSYYGGYNNYGTYPGGNWNYRQDIVLFEPSDSSGDWTSTGSSAGGESVTQVTGAEGGTPVFTSSIRWRFGNLVFTKENDGLVFWGGFSGYSPTYSSRTSSSYYNATGYVGSFYSYDFDTGNIANALAFSDGGANLTVGTTQTSVGSSWTASYQKNGGVIKPIGGFMSKNREYVYIVQSGAISTTDKEHLRLIGVNVNSLDGSSTDSGHTEGEGFAVGNWPDRRGFTVNYGGSTYPYLYRPIQRGNGRYPAGGIYGAEVVMAKDSGWVFFGAHYQNYGGSSSSTYYAYPTYPTYTNYNYYGPYRGQVAVFDADVGGDVNLISGLNEPSGSSYTEAAQFVKYIEPSYDGKSVAYVYATKSSYSYCVGNEQERIGYITDLELDEDTGAIGTGADAPDNSLKDLVGSKSRIATSVAHGPFGGTLYWAHGSSNENGKTLKQRLKGETTDVNFGLPTRRWNILHAAR